MENMQVSLFFLNAVNLYKLISGTFITLSLKKYYIQQFDVIAQRKGLERSLLEAQSIWLWHQGQGFTSCLMFQVSVLLFQYLIKTTLFSRSLVIFDSHLNKTTQKRTVVPLLLIILTYITHIYFPNLIIFIFHMFSYISHGKYLKRSRVLKATCACTECEFSIMWKGLLHREPAKCISTR